MDKRFRIVMLASRDESSNILYHALKDEFQIDKVIIEEPVPKKRVIANRVKRLGYLKVTGQLLFILFNKIVAGFSKPRIEAIKQENQLDDSAIDEDKILHVSSINDSEVTLHLKKINPDAVVVNGTRIIAERVITALDKPFLNTHVGITPKYRGVHGGYWALAGRDREHCGVTVHLVDAGIDTGGVLHQETIAVTQEDSFNTYPYLQLAKAIPLMRLALREAAEGKLRTIDTDLPSKLWYHPTLWEYIAGYWKEGVK